MTQDQALAATLERIAATLERLAPPPASTLELSTADAFVWEAQVERTAAAHPARGRRAVRAPGRHRARGRCLVRQHAPFAQGLPANNALLWGARGMGKAPWSRPSTARINEQVSRAP